MLKIVNFLVLLLISLPAYADNSCLETRYVFDIGSGTTKSKAYLVDKCKKKIVKTIGEINKHIRYQECISKSLDKKTILKSCLIEGLQAIKEIKHEYGIDCNKEECAGIATAWSRNAKNAKELLDMFNKEGVKIHTVSQDDEGELGFKTALNDPELAEINPDEILVWDIGGGSFQLAALDKNNKLYSYDGQWGIFNLFQEVRQKFPKNGCDPDKERYFDKEELESIMHYVSDRVGKEVLKDKFIVEKVNNKKMRTIGIGRIMYLGIKYELELRNPITKDQIRDLIYEFAGVTVEEAYKKFPRLPAHFVTLVQQSLILVWGIMDGAGISQIEIVDSTLTDHIALDEDYWKATTN